MTKAQFRDEMLRRQKDQIDALDGIRDALEDGIREVLVEILKSLENYTAVISMLIERKELLAPKSDTETKDEE